jgi:hypothetical protein
LTRATNHQTTPLGRSLAQIALRKVQDGQQLQGKNLPCHVTAIKGAIVTVAFDVTSQYTLPKMDIPIANSQYGREAIQIGDKGYASSGDAYIGNNSGLGENTSNLSPRANLSNLVFHPIGNKNWGPVDSNQNTHSAPNGGLYQTDDGKMQVIIKQSSVTVKSDKKVITVNMTTNGTIAISIDPGPNTSTDMLYLGGDGTQPSKYAPVSTISGPCINVLGRYVA